MLDGIPVGLQVFVVQLQLVYGNCFTWNMDSLVTLPPLMDIGREEEDWGGPDRLMACSDRQA